MVESSLRFRSKIDVWLFLIMLPAVLIGPVMLFTLPKSTPVAILLLPFAADAVVIGVLAWAFANTAYVVTDSNLIISCGPLRKSVPLAEITRIRPTRTLLSAPALSLDRLAVDCGRYGTVVISPDDKTGFAAAVLARAPKVDVET